MTVPGAKNHCGAGFPLWYFVAVSNRNFDGAINEVSEI